MKLPESKNPKYINAFRKGYKIGLHSKDHIIVVPSSIKNDYELYSHFQKGKLQAEDELQARLDKQTPKWKLRIIWWAFMILGGIATGASMIYQSKDYRETATEDANPNIQFDLDQELTLLSKEARYDLTLSRLEKADQVIIDTTIKLIPSNIHFSNYNLSHQQQNITSILNWDEIIPRNIKRITFTSYVNISNQKLTIQWIYKNQLIQEQTINTQATQKITTQLLLARKWAGEWVIQIVNKNNQPIFRQNFNYIR